MIVGYERPQIELDGGVQLEKIDGLRRMLEIRINPSGVEVRSGFMLEIDARLFGAVVHPGPASRRTRRNPQPPAGSRAGAAEHWLLLDDQNILMVVSGSDRGCEPSRP